MDGVKWVYLLGKVLPHRGRDVHLLQPAKSTERSFLCQPHSGLIYPTLKARPGVVSTLL